MTVRPRLRVPSVALSLVLLACAALKAAAIHLNYQATRTADFVFDTGMVQHRPSLDGLLDDRFVKAVPE